MSEDPIGFNGGINFYAYVENNPVNANDPMGKDFVGATLGVGGARLIKLPFLPPIPIAGGISVTVAVDSNLDWIAVFTHEIGLGTPCEAGFVRGVYAPNDAAVVTDLEGLALSFSPQVGPVSGSVSFPIVGGTPQFDNPIYEFGYGTGAGGASVTIGYGDRRLGSNASLNDPAIVGAGGTFYQCSQDPVQEVYTK